MKKDKKPEYIKAIEAKPKEERTINERHKLWNWQFNNPSTLEEKKIVAEIKKAAAEAQESINRTLKLLGVENAPPEEQQRALMLHLKQKEEALQEKERELKEREEKLQEEQKGSYRKPRHLVSAMTQIRPANDKKEIGLFSEMDETELSKIKTPPIIGLDLTRGERKLVNCFSLMLHERSNTYNSEAKDYYSGDTKNPEIVHYSDKISAPSPELRFTLYELTKVYSRKDKPSGGEIRVVRNILEKLVRKSYYIELNPLSHKGRNGENIKVRWRGMQPLLILGDVLDGDTKGELLIQLNAIFAVQIRNYYVNYPINFDQLLEEAYLKSYESNRPPSGVYIFIDYLAENRGVKGIYKHEIYKSNLYKLINYKWLERSKLKELNDAISKGIEVAQKIGLLEKWEEVTGATGEIKYVFYTNKEWIKRGKPVRT